MGERRKQQRVDEGGALEAIANPCRTMDPSSELSRFPTSVRCMYESNRRRQGFGIMLVDGPMEWS